MTSAESKPAGVRRTRGGRRHARELAVQGVYQWLLNVTPAETLLAQLKEQDETSEQEYLSRLIHGATAQADALRAKLVPHLDRDVSQLSPVEHAILLLGAFELAHCHEVPFRVVINEAVELAKTFGGTDGHKYINGVLDRLALDLRPEDTARKRDAQ